MCVCILGKIDDYVSSSRCLVSSYKNKGTKSKANRKYISNIKKRGRGKEKN